MALMRSLQQTLDVDLVAPVLGHAGVERLTLAAAQSGGGLGGARDHQLPLGPCLVLQHLLLVV